MNKVSLHSKHHCIHDIPRSTSTQCGFRCRSLLRMKQPTRWEKQVLKLISVVSHIIRQPGTPRRTTRGPAPPREADEKRNGIGVIIVAGSWLASFCNSRPLRSMCCRPHHNSAECLVMSCSLPCPNRFSCRLYIHLHVVDAKPVL
jgi:hypothetical protein